MSKSNDLSTQALSKMYVNGAIVSSTTAKISCWDRGFLLADGIFETMRVEHGQCFWLDAHLQRLRNSAAVLYIEPMPSTAELTNAIEQMLRHWGHQKAITLRLTITRGVSSHRGLAPPPLSKPSIIITGATLEIQNSLRRIRVHIAQNTRRNEYSALCRIKSLNYGDNLLALLEAKQAGADDALLRNTQGMLACASTGNVFAQINGQWVTPSVQCGAMPGIARAKLLQQLNAQEAPISVDALKNASELLISNSLACVQVQEVLGFQQPFKGEELSDRVLAIYTSNHRQ